MNEDHRFLARWSRRKAQARQGEPLPEPAPPAPAAPVAATPPPAAVPLPEPAAAEASPPAPPPPTLAEAAELTPASDFRRFVAPEVSPEVKNAALKKLFADPHFNVMDGLDIYIDDYGQPDPLPPGMLEQMVQSAALGLFDTPADDRTSADAAASADVPSSPPPSDLPGAAAAEATAEDLPDENPDLRLQPDDAAGRPGAAEGPGGHPGREP